MQDITSHRRLLLTPSLSGPILLRPAITYTVLSRPCTIQALSQRCTVTQILPLRTSYFRHSPTGTSYYVIPIQPDITRALPGRHSVTLTLTEATYPRSLLQPRHYLQPPTMVGPVVRHLHMLRSDTCEWVRRKELGQLQEREWNVEG